MLVAPRRGHPVHEHPGETLREVHELPYRIIYSVLATTVIIITIVHFTQRRKAPGP